MTDQLKTTLINAGKILYSEQQGDDIFGHVTVRLPDDAGHFLMKPHTFGLEEITMENIITVNLDGEKTAGSAPRHLEVFIHSEILRARSDVQAVVHTHAPHAVAFSALGRPLQPVGHEGSVFCDGLPVFDETTDLIVTQERGKSVAKALGKHHAVLLQNHGLVTAGRTIQEATMLAIHLERACKSQLMVESCGGATRLSTPDDAKAKQGRIIPQYASVFAYLERKVCGCGQAHDED